ncbi:DUF2953 domain-containing protein [Methanobacterium sp.]|uniref:DUF2953 domain-containing protein n=1 Tax=Methanobacterium sp. TaxID=2164 RepID=UPI003C732F1D
MTILTILLLLLLILFILIVLIMIVPFYVVLKLDIKGFKLSGYFKLEWIKIRLLQRKIDPDKKEQITDAKEKKENKKIENIPQIISLAYQSSPYLIRIFNAFLKSTVIKKLSLKLNIGLDDPYGTAMTFGYLSAVRALINLIPNVVFSVEPDFEKEYLAAQIDFKFKIRLLEIIVESLRALTKKPVRSLLNELRKTNKYT